MIKDKALAEKRAVIEMKAHAKERAMKNVSVADGQHDIEMKAHAEKRAMRERERCLLVHQ